METAQNKILWVTIKSAIRKDIQSRKIKNPNIRLGAIESIEGLLRSYSNNEYRNPIDLLKLDKDELKAKLAKNKSSGSLSGAEESIINNIYEYLKNNVTDTDNK